MKAVVLAAGEGRRLRPLTTSQPKPLLPLLDRPLIEHLIRGLLRFGVQEVLANLHHQAETLERYVARSEYGRALILRREGELSGTAGGVRRFADVLQGEREFLVVSADAAHEVDYGSLIAAHRVQEASLTVVTKEVADARPYGTAVVDADNRIVRFAEKQHGNTARSGL